MSVLRVKVKVLPYGEGLCILANENSTIDDVKAKIFNAVSYYPIYKQYLEFCTIHLELQINDESFGVPQHYALKDCLTEKDVIIASFVEHNDYKNRTSIHIKHQSKPDLMMRSNKNNMGPINKRNRNQTKQMALTSYNKTENKNNTENQEFAMCTSPEFMMSSPEPPIGSNPNNNNNAQSFNNNNNNNKPVMFYFFVFIVTHIMIECVYIIIQFVDNGKARINDICQWIKSELSLNGILHAIYTQSYKEFVNKLIERYGASLNQHTSDLQSFLTDIVGLEIVKSAQGWSIQLDASAKPENNVQKSSVFDSISMTNDNNNNNKGKKKNKKKKNKNKNKNNNNDYNNNNNASQQGKLQSVPEQNNDGFENEADVIPNPYSTNSIATFNNIMIPNTNNKHNKNNNNLPQHELPTTPDSPTDEEEEEEYVENGDNNDIGYDEKNQEKNGPSMYFSCCLCFFHKF